MMEGNASDILIGMVELLSQQSVETIKKVWAGWQELLEREHDSGQMREILEMVVQNALKIKEEAA